MMCKCRGFRGLRDFFTLFHAFFTMFSRVSTLVFAGCGKKGLFFYFSEGAKTIFGLGRSLALPGLDNGL